MYLRTVVGLALMTSALWTLLTGSLLHWIPVLTGISIVLTVKSRRK